MDSKNHIILFIICIAVWIIFFLLGLFNNHYQTWSLDMQLIHCGDIVLLVWPMVYVVLKKISNKNYFLHSIWFAFYGSVPLALLDYVYLHGIKGYDFSYLSTHWYLTIFYFIVWIEMPLIGYYLEKNKKQLPSHG
jgi:hypothetical protein